MSRGARIGRRLRRQISHGVLVEFVSETEKGEMLSCGHEGPKGVLPPKHGRIMRHCTQCPLLENKIINVNT